MNLQLGARETTGRRALNQGRVGSTDAKVIGFPIVFEANASERWYSIRVCEPVVTVSDSDALSTRSWLDASAIELGGFLREIESKLSEEDVRAWLAAFEE